MESEMKKLLLLGILPFVLVLAIVLSLFLPSVQSVMYYLLIATPSIPYWLTIGGVLAGLLYKFKPSVTLSTERFTDEDSLIPQVEKSINLVLVVVVVSLVLAFIIGPIMSGVYAHEHMASEVSSSAEVVDSLPNTSEESVRVLPRSVAEVYADSSVQAPQHRLSSADLTEVNGTYMWSFALVPDNPMVQVFGNQMGSMYVSMEQQEKDTRVVEQTSQNGRGQLFIDSHSYQNVLNAPLESHEWDTRFDTIHNGSSYTVHSTVSHEWKFRFSPLPQVYSVPQHESVKITHPDGTIESLSPEAAQDDPRLDGENFYPYSLSNFKVNSIKYENGALNKWFWKEGVFSVASLPEGGNSWPLTVPTKTESGGEELTYFTATEPADGGSGVFEVWMIDGQTGETSVQEYSDSQIGPQRAIEAVKRQQAVNRLSDADVVSPVPIVKNGQLYWHTKVIPKSGNGLIYTAFVDATSGEVTVVDGTEQVYAFLTQDEVEEIEEDAQESEETMTVTVVVTDNDGDELETQEISVPAGGNIEISVNDTSNNSTTTSS